MRKNILFSLLVAIAMTVGSTAWTMCNASVTITKASPFFEGFEGCNTRYQNGVPFYYLPNGWSKINNGGNQYLPYSYWVPCATAYYSGITDKPRTGSRNALFMQGTGMLSIASNEFMIFPEVTNNVSELTLKLYATASRTDANNQIVVGVMTSPTDANTFTAVSALTFSQLGTYEEKVIPFSSYTGNGKYIAIRAIQSGTYMVSVDDITMTVPAISAVNASANSAEYGYVEKICQAADTTAEGKFYDGKTITLVAHANPGYKLVNWSNSATTDSLTFVVSNDITLTANFAPTYRVFALAGNPLMGTVAGSGVQTAGQVTLTAAANANYHFVDWSNGTNDAQLTFDLQSDTAIVANFAIDRYSVSAEPNNRKLGYVTGDLGEWDHGTELTLTANPMDEHVTFTGWSDGSKDNQHTIILDKDVSLIANFVKDSFDVTVIAGDGGTVSGGGTYDYGSMVNIKATPNDGYYFVNWSNGKTCEEISIYVAEDTTITANFQADVPASGIQPYAGKTEEEASKYVRNGFLYISNSEAIYDAKGAKVE